MEGRRKQFEWISLLLGIRPDLPDEEEPEEELDEEERRLLAERETQRRAEQSREAEMRSEVVDFF